jgi:hypothetical protein
MRKYILGAGVLFGFSFAAVAAAQIAGKTVTIPQGNRINGGSVCDAVADNLVSNCGFELSAACDVSPVGCPDAFLPQWTPSGDLSWFGVTSAPAFVNSGTNGAFAGPILDLGYITQTLPTSAGTSYILTFWLASGVPMNHFVVVWDGSVVFELIDSAPFPFTSFVVPDLVASIDGTDLSFGFYQPPDFWGLDDVIVEAAAK